MVNVLKEITEKTNKLNNRVLDAGATPTDWSFYGSLLQDSPLLFTYHRAPGFFTPFKQSNGGVKQAAHTLKIVASFHLIQGVATLFLGPPIALYSAINSCCQGQGDLAKKSALNFVIAPIAGLYFLGTFVVQLLKELTALITRSIATLVDLCKGPNDSNIEDTEDSSEEEKQNEVDWVLRSF